MTAADVALARDEAAVTLARDSAAQVREIGTMIFALAEGADLAMAGGEPAKVVAYRMITACRLIARATRGQAVTP